jgi:hypothetical protein
VLAVHQVAQGRLLGHGFSSSVAVHWSIPLCVRPGVNGNS